MLFGKKAANLQGRSCRYWIGHTGRRYGGNATGKQDSNASSEPATILFFFNKPAFDQCLRAYSSRPGEKFALPLPEKMAAVEQQRRQVMKH